MGTTISEDTIPRLSRILPNSAPEVVVRRGPAGLRRAGAGSGAWGEGRLGPVLSAALDRGVRRRIRTRAQSRRAFPDQRHEMIQLRHSDDAVICEFYLLGTHKGPFGAIPATGSTFKVRMTGFFIFEGEVLVCERVYFDVLTLLKQLIAGMDFKKPANWALLARAALGARKELG